MFNSMIRGAFKTRVETVESDIGLLRVYALVYDIKYVTNWDSTREKTRWLVGAVLKGTKRESTASTIFYVYLFTI